MEDDTLKDFWKAGIDNKINSYTKDELNEILLAKARASIRKFYSLDVLPIITIAFLFYLTASSVMRLHDLLFVLGNLALAIIMTIAFILNVVSFKRMNKYDSTQSLKAWLKYRIDELEKSLYSVYGYFIPPVIFLLTLISLNVFLQNKPYIEVILSLDFMFALLVGVAVGIPVSYLMNRRGRKIYMESLYNLRLLYGQMDDEK